MKSESFVSVVLSDADGLVTNGPAIASMQAALSARFADYEIVVVAPGPGVVVPAEVTRLLADVPCIRYLQLASAASVDSALAVGLEVAIGDCVVTWDPRTDPVEVVETAVVSCLGGADVVIGVSTERPSLPYRTARALSTALLSAIGYHLPRNATGLRCLSRRAANAVVRAGSSRYQFHLRIQQTGYQAVPFPYKPIEPHHELSLREGLRRLVALLVFNSSKPLRWASLLGLGGSALAFVIALYAVLVNMVRGHVAEGWTTMVLTVSGLFMVQFSILSIFGEYLGRILDERTGVADVSVVYEKTSSAMVDANRLNVYSEAVSHEVNRVQTGRDR